MVTTIIIIIMCLTVVTIYLASYITHIDMVRDNCMTWSWGTYKEFVEQLNDNEWDHKADWPMSYFGVGNSYTKYKVHADIFKFDGVGMIIVPWDWIPVKVHLWNERLRPTKHIDHKWEV